MSLRKTIVLALLLAAALGYVFYVEVPRGVELEKAEKLFADVPRARIAEISITRNEGSYQLKNLKPVTVAEAENASSEQAAEQQELNEPGKSWQLGEIAGSSLESGVLTGLTSAMADLKLGKKLAAEDVEGDLSVYGLSKPEMTVEVKATTTDGKPFNATLRFGKRNDFVKERYLQVTTAPGDAGSIYLVPDALFLAANKPATDFRSKEFVSFADADVRALEISSPQSSLQVRREDEASAAGVVRRSPWQLVGVANGAGASRLSEEGVAELLRELRNARAQEFIDGDQAKDPAQYGLGEKSARLQVQFSDDAKPPLEVRLQYVADKDGFGRGPGTYLSLSNQQSIVFVGQDLTSKLIKSADALRELALFRIPTADAQRIEITRLDGEVLAVEKSSAGLWTLAQGADAAGTPSGESTGSIADGVFVDELLGSLSRIQAQSFPKDSRDFGFAPPKAKVRIEFKSTGDGQARDRVASLLIGNRVSSDASADFFAGVLEGAQVEVSEPFVLKASDVEKILPRREVLAPVPTPLPTSAPAAAPAQEGVATIAPSH